MIMIDKERTLNNKTFEEECSILKQVNDIIMKDPSWSDELKQKVSDAFDIAIGSMLYVSTVIDEQDDLK